MEQLDLASVATPRFYIELKPCEVPQISDHTDFGYLLDRYITELPVAKVKDLTLLLNLLIMQAGRLAENEALADSFRNEVKASCGKALLHVKDSIEPYLA